MTNTNTNESKSVEGRVEEWHAPGLGEVHDHEHNVIAYCMKEEDGEQIMDDERARQIVREHNAAPYSLLTDVQRAAIDAAIAAQADGVKA